VLRSGGCQQSDDLIDRLVGAVVGGFELGMWAMFCIGLVVEGAVASPQNPNLQPGWPSNSFSIPLISVPM
jgi:hypothetical protein